MTVWLVLCALLLAALALLLVPLLRRQVSGPSRIGYDLVVYRDQLAEVDRDRERGLMSDEQVAASRTEIQRRMLTAEEADNADAPVLDARALEAGRWLRLVAAIAILVLVPGGTIGLYRLLGAPELPGQPYAARQNSPDFKMIDMAERLKSDLARNPDIGGYTLLGETYRNLNRFDDSANAFRQAVDLGGTGADLFSAYGEALTMAGDGAVGPEARAAFIEAMKADPNDFRSRFYLGLSKTQIGKYAEAIAIWRDLEQDAPADAPWRPMVDGQIAEAAKDGKLDPATIAPHRPSTDGVPAIATAKDGPGADGQQAVIRQMVTGLAARLQKEPNDLDGWMRLARSYRVLGELPKAREAADRAVKLDPKSVEARLELGDVQMASAKDEDDLPGDFIATMRQVLTLQPGNPNALYFMGLSEAKAGHTAQARDYWTKILAQFPADAPQRAEVQKLLDGLK